MKEKPQLEGNATDRFLNRLRETTGRETAADRGAKMATVEFRCAKTGEKFVTVMLRHSDKHPFEIQSILKADDPNAPIKAAVEAASMDVAHSVLESSDNFRWSGWYCPCCQHRQTEELPVTFVQCGTCKELVCGGRARRLEDGTEMFSCHDDCGGGGKISTTSSITSVGTVRPASGRLDGGGGSQRLLKGG